MGGKRRSVSLSSKVSSAVRLQPNQYGCQFEVSLFLKLSQHPCPEEHFAVSNTVGCWVELQMLDLQYNINQYKRNRETWSILNVIITIEWWLTIISAAFFPSMNPLAITPGVRISYR